MYRHAYYSKANNIHSSGKIECFNNFVENKSIIFGCKQHIITNDNHIITINIKTTIAITNVIFKHIAITINVAIFIDVAITFLIIKYLCS